MSEETPNPNLLWVDLETTGLSEHDELPLEIAIVVTDSDLNELFEYSRVINQTLVLNELSEWVLETHSKNGLLAEVVKSDYQVEEVDRVVASILRRADLWPDIVLPPLCGSTINFERRWLAAYFPDSYSRIHYRSIDVSSLKELMQRWRPEAAISTEETSPHRALDDIRASIAELAHYRKVLSW